MTTVQTEDLVCGLWILMFLDSLAVVERVYKIIDMVFTSTLVL